MYDYRLSPSLFLFYIHLLLFLLSLLVAIAPFLTPPSAPLIPRCPIVYRPRPARSLKNRPIHFQLTSFLSRFETICVEIAGSFTLLRNSDKKSSKTVFFSFLKFDCSPISKSFLERSNRKQKRSSSE